ncbi:MAG: 50S ribosomal protein L15 [Proteobacteria bacterium]|nr:50S ribosomal protein L15 [Pseudomonadota bacterium]
MLDRLEPHPGAQKRPKRVGRGPGSGTGRYCGRGVKGQGHRSSGRETPLYYEGGQMPLVQRVPKRGFSNHRFKKDVEVVNLSELAVFGEGAVVDVEALKKQGLVRGKGALVKVLGEGDAPAKLQIKVNRISAGARQKVEAAGGSVELVG